MRATRPEARHKERGLRTEHKPCCREGGVVCVCVCVCMCVRVFVCVWRRGGVGEAEDCCLNDKKKKKREYICRITLTRLYISNQCKYITNSPMAYGTVSPAAFNRLINSCSLLNNNVAVMQEIKINLTPETF